MNVAVCDDLKESLMQIESLLNQISDVQKIETFSDMNAFCEELKAGNIYDVILMDIDWNQEKTGIDFAEEIYQYSPSSKIIYVTAYTADYIEDIFLNQVNLCGFLMKPVKLEQLERNLEKAKARGQELEGKLVIRQKGAIVAIPFQEIIYMESQLHKANIVLDDVTYQCNEKLMQLKERLDDRFLECHKSYLVNMHYIQELQNSRVLLTTGMTVPISKAKASDSKKTFFEYMSRRI